MSGPLENLQRSHYCGRLRAEHEGQAVTLFGWVQRRRDLGGLLLGFVGAEPHARPTANPGDKPEGSLVRRRRLHRGPHLGHARNRYAALPNGQALARRAVQTDLRHRRKINIFNVEYPENVDMYVNSLSLRLRTIERTFLTGIPQVIAAIMIPRRTIFNMLFIIELKSINNRNPGITMIVSEKRSITFSSRPPLYPAMSPKGTPMAKPKTEPTIPTITEFLMAYVINQKRS